MATIKHISSKSADYGAAERYLLYEHHEHTSKPVLDEQGRLILRENVRIATLNCGVEDFAFACMRANRKHDKNNKPGDVKTHHYIISFDPRDASDHGLTVERAHSLGIEFCKENLPGHQAIIAVHNDGHHLAGNIHVHIVINSLRIHDVERKKYMDRGCDTQAGAKHRCTGAALRYFREQVMKMCEREGLYQIDLLSGSRHRITDREYHAKMRGQAKTEMRAKALSEKTGNSIQMEFRTGKYRIRYAIKQTLRQATDFSDFQKILERDYRITLKESRGRFSYLASGRQKPITSCMLGKDTSKEHILAVLEENRLKRQEELDAAARERRRQRFLKVSGKTEQKTSVTAPSAATTPAPEFERVIDIEKKKVEGKGAGFEIWAKSFNLK